MADAQILNPSAPQGLHRAASSRLEWDVRDAIHPILGTIRYAALRTVQTPVGDRKVYSRAAVSCQKGALMLAVELSNGTSVDEPRGLKPARDPVLLCNRPEPPGAEKLVQEELLANWDVNAQGEALSLGFRPFPLRECVSINVQQEVILPAGWPQKTAKVEFTITPYTRQLDDVFVTCGDVTAWDTPADQRVTVAAANPSAAPTPAPTPMKLPAQPAPPKPTAVANVVPKPVAAVPTPAPPPPKPAPAPAAAGEPWINARAFSTGGKTNVRAAPNLGSAVVIQLDPGTPVLVQKTATEWWKAKAAAGNAPFEGYIRQDRLAFR